MLVSLFSLYFCSVLSLDSTDRNVLVALYHFWYWYGDFEASGCFFLFIEIFLRLAFMNLPTQPLFYLVLWCCFALLFVSVRK